MAKFIQGETNYEEWRDHSRDSKKYKERMAVISEMLAKKNELTFADQIKLVMCIVVSALTGKLEDFFAVSTSVLMNKICQARAKIEGCICKDCYAAAGCSRFAGLCQGVETNFLILNNFLLSIEAWKLLAIPSINGKARIEAHGDVASVVCAINYNRIVESHKHLIFAVFSKNLDIWKKVFETEGKPDNMIFIASSPMVNEIMEIPDDMKQYVDHVFTVFDEEYARKHGIKINCGTWEGHDLDHRCKRCDRCYDPTNKEYYINEVKK